MADAPLGPYVLRLLDAPVPDAFDGIPVYLESWDVEAFDGRGEATSTTNLADAHRFPTAIDAMRTWRTTSVKRPLRADGKPNRPLTAFTVEVVRLGDVTG